MPFKEKPDGQTYSCPHETKNPSGICDMCLGVQDTPTSWEIEIARMLDDFPDRNKFKAANKIILRIKSELTHAREEVLKETRARIHNWVEVMMKDNAFNNAEWTGTDEIEASVMSYIEGNHLSK